MEIRKVKESDVTDIFALVQAKAEFDGCLENLESSIEDIRIAFFSEHPKAKAIVAVENGRGIGIATYYDIYSTFIAKSGLWLDDLYIYEEYRGAGIGKALVKALCSIALETGCGRIDWIVARDNELGRDFYHSVGAEIFELVRHSRLDEPAIIKLASGV